jgi:hypothetical protein
MRKKATTKRLCGITRKTVSSSCGSSSGKDVGVFLALPVCIPSSAVIAVESTLRKS